MKVDVIIEQNSKGRYSAYINDDRIPFGVLGEGNSVEETIEDFKIGYEEIKEAYQCVGKTVPELEFCFKHDIASFLSLYSKELTLAGLSRITKVNKGQLSHYVTGRKRPRANTINKIRTSVRNFGSTLSKVEFA